MYNFEVEDLHTYFVCEDAVLVHNLCEIPDAPKKITGYTKHGWERAMWRDGHGVKPSAILKTGKNGVRKYDSVRKVFIYSSYDAKVVLNKAGEIVTTFAKHKTGYRY